MDSISEAAKVQEMSRIKDLLYRKGLTLAEIDRQYQLTPGTARNTLRQPSLPGERAIAAALGTKPYLLWRSRYHSSGQRKPRQDYRRPLPMEQRRKMARA